MFSILSYPSLVSFLKIFFLWWYHGFIVLFLSVIFGNFFSFYFCQHLHMNMIQIVFCNALAFILNSADCLNKWSCAINVLRILNCLFVIFIVNQEGIHTPWLLCGFIDPTDAITGEPRQKLCAFIIIHYGIFKNLFALHWIT